MSKNRPALFRGRHFQDQIIVLCVRWYLRYSLSYRDVQELMAERGLSVDHSTVWRWVQRYAPILNQRIRREVRHPNRSWRIDETYIRMAGRWVYLYRAVESCGETIEFMLSPKRDLIAAKHFLQLALWRVGQVRPRVINVDGHPAYATAISELKQSAEIGKQCRCRPSHVHEQHRGARPPIHQETNRRRSVVSIHRRRAEHDRRIRGDAHHSERADPLAVKGRCGRAGRIHSPHLWYRRVNAPEVLGPFARTNRIC